MVFRTFLALGVVDILRDDHVYLDLIKSGTLYQGLLIARVGLR